jgi:hypothetical protein
MTFQAGVGLLSHHTEKVVLNLNTKEGKNIKERVGGTGIEPVTSAL